MAPGSGTTPVSCSSTVVLEMLGQSWVKVTDQV